MQTYMFKRIAASVSSIKRVGSLATKMGAIDMLSNALKDLVWLDLDADLEVESKREANEVAYNIDYILDIWKPIYSDPDPKPEVEMPPAYHFAEENLRNLAKRLQKVTIQ